MRLFSLGRTPQLSLTQKDDLEVVSEEIGFIENTVQHFLDFSRPPKLKIQRASPSDATDMALRLLRDRLESNGVDVQLLRQKRLSQLEMDPVRLEEVLVNLMVNACEAMPGGGAIVLEEREELMEPSRRVAVIRLTDNGPGIPQFAQDKVLQPFYSTKEDGTGLGLSVAARIVEEHGGELNLESKEEGGTTFVITLPFKEENGSEESWS
jgi:signal transduction histidine kinase